MTLRHAFRSLVTHSASTFVIVASLAIGIGANTAIFSVVNALLLEPLPFPDPDRLAVLWLRSPGINIPQDWPSPGQYIDILNENRTFESMAISRGRTATLIGRDQPERAQILLTSSNLFQILGARALHGRLLIADDDVPGKPLVVVLGHGFWKRTFGGDPGIVGRSITLNGLGADGGKNNNQFVVAGVTEPGFELNDEVMQTVAAIRQIDLYLPLPLAADAVTRRGDENYNLTGRLKPGVTIEQAQSDIGAIAGRIRDQDKRDKTFTISVVSLQEQVVGNVRRTLLVLLGSVALVLLIACANVANLLLTRASGRQKEVAIRTALGASWRRMAGEMLTESVLLGVLGGAAGLLVANAGLSLVRTLNPGNIPRLDAIAIDPTVLAFTFTISLLTGVIFGLAPVVRAVRIDVNTALKAGGRNAQGDGGFGSSRPRLRSLLVVAELAISVMLLIGAGLLIRSFARLQSVPPGFNPDHVITMRIGTGVRQTQLTGPDAAAEYFRQFGDKIAAVPGVTMRGAVSSLPFTASVGWGSINVEGFIPQPGQELQVDQRAATADYFRTMEIPLVKGRFFTAFDTLPNAERVGIVDEKFARRFWPNEDPIGKHVWFDPKQQMTIVGVVGTVKQYGLDVDGRIVFYRPSAGALGYQVARTSGEPAAAAASIVRAIREVDPTIPVYDIRTMHDRMSDSLARQRFSMVMLGGFAGFALLLAVIGVYGVLSYLVSQSRQEIGVRMALGAQRSRIVAMVMRQGLQLTVAGTMIGLAGAVALTRVMATMLFGISATDLATFSVVPLVLVIVAALACFVPAHRATRVDPQTALRVE